MRGVGGEKIKKAVQETQKLAKETEKVAKKKFNNGEITFAELTRFKEEFQSKWKKDYVEYVHFIYI